MAILINILLVINLIIGLLLIVVTLMQRPKQEGLGAAFGGGMTDNLFGAQTTNVLAKGTRFLGGVFLVLSLVISSLFARQVNSKSGVERDLLSSPIPVATPEAGAAATPEPMTPDASATPEAIATPEAESPAVTATPEAAATEAVATPEPALEAAPEAVATPEEAAAATPSDTPAEAGEEAPAATPAIEATPEPVVVP